MEAFLNSEVINEAKEENNDRWEVNINGMTHIWFPDKTVSFKQRLDNAKDHKLSEPFIHEPEGEIFLAFKHILSKHERVKGEVGYEWFRKVECHLVFGREVGSISERAKST